MAKAVISEEVSPLQTIAPSADDGHATLGYLRKPPGDGPFPAVVLVHGGLIRIYAPSGMSPAAFSSEARSSKVRRKEKGAGAFAAGRVLWWEIAS